MPSCDIAGLRGTFKKIIPNVFPASILTGNAIIHATMKDIPPIIPLSIVNNRIMLFPCVPNALIIPISLCLSRIESDTDEMIVNAPTISDRKLIITRNDAISRI